MRRVPVLRLGSGPRQVGVPVTRLALAYALERLQPGRTIDEQPNAVLLRLAELTRQGLVVWIDGGWHLTDAGRDLVAEAREEADA